MAAIQHDIEIEEGTTFSYILTIQDRDDSTGEITPVDLSGMTAAASIKASFRSTEPSIADFEVTIEAPEEGRIRMELPASVTRSLILDADKPSSISGDTYETYTIGYYDLELVHTASDFVTRLLRGTVTYSDEITT
jgi:hypothetical protein